MTRSNRFQLAIMGLITLALIVILSSCETYKRNVIRQRIISEEGTVIAINMDYGFYTVFWECENPKYRNQPCFGISDHPMRSGINLGDTVKITIK
jgi:hypothetical protein